jgi:hypothetical protein
MSNISEHNAEKKGESHRCENRRIYLLVAWYAVSVGNLLRNNGVRVRPERSRRLGEA